MAADSPVEQRIRVCTSGDGTRLAYATSGEGPVLVKAPNYLTHLEYDWESPVWRHWMRDLSAHWTLVRYDARGCGMSDIDVDDSGFSLETWLDDLDTVVDAAGLRTFPLLGVSAGGAIAIAYAARRPERVSRLILYGAYARGRFQASNDPADRREAELLLELMSIGWARENAAFRRVFTMLFMPEGSEEQLGWFDELQRITTPPENAVRFERAYYDLDVREDASRLDVPTLILHAQGDAMCPVDGAKELASIIPKSELVQLPGKNHIILQHEPSWQRFLHAVEEFLNRSTERTADRRLHLLQELTTRETEVLDLIAKGLSNDEIAEQLVVSPHTIRNHITRIFRKLEVRDRAQAVVVARDGGLGRS